MRYKRPFIRDNFHVVSRNYVNCTTFLVFVVIKKVKDFANNVKTSIENESRMKDLEKIIEKQKSELSEFEDKIDIDEK